MSKQLCVYKLNNGRAMVFDGQHQVPKYQEVWTEALNLLSKDNYQLTELFETSVMGFPATRYTADLVEK